jgi:hypothetical protein
LAALAADLASLCADHTAIERIYYNHRLGEKPPFDLPKEFQSVLRAQLRQPGDVSAVIERPNGFQLYVLRSRSASALSIGALFLPKRSYEAWLTEVRSESKGPSST